MRPTADGSPASESLRLLAEGRGVATSYTDAFGVRRQVSDETLLAVVQALGLPLESATDAGRLLAAEPLASEEALYLPPVLVAWDGELPPLRLGPPEALRAITIALALEDGSEAGESLRLAVEEAAVVVRAAAPIPFGRHELAVGRPGRAPGSPSGSPSRLEEEPDEIAVISAPRRAPALTGPSCGAYLPTYALRGADGEGGHLGLLASAGEGLARRGASYLATLPLLADLAAEGDFPGPYSPLTRLFWNEGFLDPSALPELASVLDGTTFGRGASERARALRPHLPAALARLRDNGGARLAAFEAYLEARPEVLDYARYRAACEARGGDRRGWPARWRRGLIEDREVDPAAIEAHSYAQFAIESQLDETTGRLEASGSRLMLDLPLGSRGDGYDPWAFPEAFAPGVRIGAPPDRFFTGGQDWGFPPLSPPAERAGGYAVTTACLQNMLAHAKALRIDHVLGLSRLWWIPAEMGPTEGTYVSYPTEELLALHSLEAWRAGAVLVGENLGTVEPGFTALLAEHNIAGMKVAVFDLESPDAHPMEPLAPPAGTVALVDTHDTATFAAWYRAHDIAERKARGLLDAAEAEAEQVRRERAARILSDRLVASGLLAANEAADPVAVHRGLLGELGRSEAELVLVNPEDCWGELEGQNVPGTVGRENFSRPFSRAVAEMDADAALTSAFFALSQAREERRAMAGGDEGY